MTLIDFTKPTAVKWGTTNISKVYAGTVLVWPKTPLAASATINLEDCIPGATEQVVPPTNFGPHTRIPAYEIPIGSNINFAGATSQTHTATASPELSIFFMANEAGVEVGSLTDGQTRYSDTWTFPATGIAEGDVTTVKACFDPGTKNNPSATLATILWTAPGSTFRRLPETPAAYTDLMRDMLTIPLIGAVPALIFPLINVGNCVVYPGEVTGYQDGVFRLSWARKGVVTIMTWLDVTYQGRWYFTGMTPQESTNYIWQTHDPRWGGQVSKATTARGFDGWRNPYDAGFIFDSSKVGREGWVSTTSGRVNNVADFHSNRPDALQSLGAILPANMQCIELPEIYFPLT